jgi:hypothetical protein
MEKFNSDFIYFWEMIENGTNFAFARYADGEVMLMNGQSVGIGTQASNIDKWTSPNSMTKVGADLLKTLSHTEPNYYYAISSKTDNISDYEFLINNIKQDKERITFVNLWIKLLKSLTV